MKRTICVIRLLGRTCVRSSSSRMICLCVQIRLYSSGKYQAWLVPITTVYLDDFNVLIRENLTICWCQCKSSWSFCDHSRNFAQANSKFWRNYKKCLRKLTQDQTLNQFPRKCLTNPSKNLPMQNSYCDHRNFDSVNQCFMLASQVKTRLNNFKAGLALTMNPSVSLLRRGFSWLWLRLVLRYTGC
jgi:hypothetical protein